MCKSCWRHSGSRAIRSGRPANSAVGQLIWKASHCRIASQNSSPHSRIDFEKQPFGDVAALHPNRRRPKKRPRTTVLCRSRYRGFLIDARGFPRLPALYATQSLPLIDLTLYVYVIIAARPPFESTNRKMRRTWLSANQGLRFSNGSCLVLTT